jgi:murein DD-endopeptidase MepM/ murein hydrolase activator NlpD
LLLLVAASLGAETFPCSEDVSVELDTTQPVQGQLFEVLISSKVPLSAVTAGWGGHSLYFWAENETTFRGLVGVDLRRKPAPNLLSVSVVLADGKRASCGLPFAVHKGDFVVERLNVDRKFVELSREDLARAKRESAQLREIFATITPKPLWTGPFQSPVPGIKGSGNFGKRRVFNNEPRSPHSGEDYPAPAGTPILAPQRGRVVLAADHFFSGNVVIVDHGVGLFTFHGHMRSFAVKEGDLVEAGDKLGEVGATGRVTGPHLHWTVRLARTRVNPRDLLKISR